LIIIFAFCIALLREQQGLPPEDETKGGKKKKKSRISKFDKSMI
jgi:hypothetical protein